MLRKTVAASVLAVALLSTAAVAQDQGVIDSITQELIRDGFSKSARIEYRGDMYTVHAEGPAGMTEREYRNRLLMREETVDANGVRAERAYDEAGNLVRERLQTAEGVVERHYQSGQMIKEQVQGVGAKGGFGEGAGMAPDDTPGQGGGAAGGAQNGADNGGGPTGGNAGGAAAGDHAGGPGNGAGASEGAGQGGGNGQAGGPGN